jgi:demethylmenaquinone methyltransferase/2-methoxy-6-polyprenyl-1,4-benzoquinol methylase
MLALMSKNQKSTTNKNRVETTHFGYKKVSMDEKTPLVREVFDAVAPRYDLMNDLMSIGIHRLWKRAMISWLAPRKDMELLDVGGGTGDIALRFVDRGGGNVTVVDINEEMLKAGKDKAFGNVLSNKIDWLQSNSEKLPIKDACFDAYTTAFCIRNVTHIDQMLSEAYRVLKPGGRFMCLEFSHVVLPVLENFYEAYSFKVLPALGEIVTGDREAYQYLAESIRRFPNQSMFSEMISASGLEQVKVRNLSGGIAAIHSAWRI